MNAILTYLIATIVSLGIVYAGYLVALRSETFFRLNRFYLLAGLFASFLLPLVAWMGWMPDIAASVFSALHPANKVFFGIFTLPEVEVLSAPKAGFPIWAVLKYVYLFVALCLFFRLMVRLYGMWSLRRKAELQASDGYSVCWIQDDVSPFSFFSMLFLPKILRSDLRCSDIMRHEEVHIREGHSFDIMLLQGLKVIFWFNPFLYVVEHSLRELHEFQADATVLKQGLDVESYRMLLLRQYGATQALVLSNNFNYSLIKRRLVMVTRKSSGWARYKSILMMPLVMSMVFFYASCSNAQEAKPIPVPEQKPMVTEEEPVLVVVDEMPEFPGGQAALLEFLRKNLTYPHIARVNNVQGRVVVTFVVSADGVISNVSVIRSLSPECDAEAMRVVSLMPKWGPGKQKGKPVRVQFYLPISFKSRS